MSYSLIIPLVAFTLCLILAVLVLQRNHRSNSHRLFFLFLMGLVLWSLFAFGTRSSPSPEYALNWNKGIPPAVLLASVTFLHFSFLYTRQKPGKWLLTAAYLELSVIVALAPGDLIIKGIGTDIYGYYPITGPLTYLVMISSYSFFGLGLANFIRKYKAATSYEEKNSYLIVIIGVGCFLFAGITDILSIFGAPIPPLALVGNILFGFLASIALLKYHLLDVRLVLRKGVSYLLVSSLVALPYVGIILLAGQILFANRLSPWVYLVYILILAVILQPLWRWAQRVVDRLFYRERYDYLQALSNFSSKAQRVTNLEGLGATLVELVSKSLRASGAYLLMPSASSRDFVVTSAYQSEGAEPPSSLKLSSYSPLVQWLKHNDGFVSRQDLDIVPSLQALAASERQALRETGAELCVPVKTRDRELVGILILKAKLSRQLYSTEDKQLLEPIISQMAMSLDNARLFQEAKDSYAELKSAQDYLVQSERLRALGEMSSGIAHDFNNMLTGILGRAQLALEEARSKKVKRHLGLIEQGALDAAQMVRRLQDFARVRTDLSFGLVDLNAVVKGALDILEPRLNERRERGNAATDVNLSLADTGPVQGNEAELREALVNVMINAMEAMPRGGKLNIRTEQKGDSVIVSISDTGIGMTTQDKNRIFEPFFSTKGQQGFGMGLSVVYGVVKRHGGDINVSSKLREGSTFHISFPVATEGGMKMTEEASLTGQDATRSANILVIDDDEGARNVLYEILTGAGHTVDVATSGEEGLSLARQVTYDLVVTDLGMSGISGRDVARAIKKLGAQTPVILITGWGVQTDALEQGVDDIITKPFSKKDILGRIVRLLNNQTVHDELVKGGKR